MAVAKLRGARWPVFIVLAVVFVGAAFFASEQEQASLTGAIDGEVAKAETFANGSFAELVEGIDTSTELSEARAAELRLELGRDVLSGGSTERIRVFATDGTLVFSTDGGDKIGTQLGSVDAIRAAASGSALGIESFDRVAVGEQNPGSMRLLTSYVPLSGAGDRVDAVVSVDQRYRAVERSVEGTWGIAKIGALLAAVVMLEMGLFGLARVVTAKRLASRSGFGPAKTAPQAGNERSGSKGAATGKDAEQEAETRHALEDQLETLRTRARTQREESASAAREFADQLRSAVERAETAEAKAASSAPDPTSEQRLRDAQHRVEELEHRAKTAEANVTTLEARLADATATSAADPDAERKLAEASQRADAAEHRAMEAEANVARLQAAIDSAAAAEAAPMPAGEDGELLTELQTANAVFADELEQMGMRLRRAYADAEDARAQLVAIQASPLANARNAPAEEEKSLRFRLAKTAASKKSGGDADMWS